MAQPIPPHVSKRRQRWQRLQVYFLAAMLAAMFGGMMAAVSARQAAARQAEYAKAQAAARAAWDAQTEAWRRESEEWLTRVRPFFRASEEVRRLEEARPVDARALAAARARQREAMDALVAN